MRLRSLRMLPQASPPLIILPIRAGDAQRQKEQGPLPGYCKTQLFVDNFADQLRHQCLNDDVFFPVVFKVDHWEQVTVLIAWMYSEVSLFVRLADRDGSQELFHRHLLGKRLVQPQVFWVERVRDFSTVKLIRGDRLDFWLSRHDRSPLQSARGGLVSKGLRGHGS